MRLLLIPILAFLLPLAVACTRGSHSSDRTLTLTVSIEPQRAILEAIAGERAQVQSLLRGGADPESYDPTFASMMRLERGDAYFMVGNMEFENQLAERLSPATRSRIYDTSSGALLLEGTHSCHHHDEEGEHDHEHDYDPHTWGSLANLRIMASNMLEALCSIDPQGKDYYTRRHAILDRHLDSLNGAWSHALIPVRGEAFMMWHPSLSYFARDYSLEQVSVSAEHKETTAKALQRIIGMNSGDHKPLIFLSQPGYDPRIAATVTSRLGIPRVAYDPLAYDWEGELQRVVDALISNHSSTTK